MNGEYFIIEKDYGSTYAATHFQSAFNKIFPNFDIKPWFISESKKLDKIIIEFINKVGFTDGLENLINRKDEMVLDNDVFLGNGVEYRIKKYYMADFLEPKLDDFINNVDISMGCTEMVNKFTKIIYPNLDAFSISHSNGVITDYYREKIFTLKFSQFLRTVDFSIGSSEVIKKAYKFFESDLEKFKTLINKNIEIVYKPYILLATEKYLESINLEDNTITSTKLINDFKELKLEDDFFKEISTDIINKWYVDNFFGSNQLDSYMDWTWFIYKRKNVPIF